MGTEQTRELDGVVIKFCPKCQTAKSLDEYQKNSARPDGVNSYCRDCNNLRNIGNSKLPKYVKNKLKSNYGITPEDWQLLFDNQNGCCAICNKHQSLFEKRLSVDHNHITGKVRGLLCHNCNLALGILKTDINTDLLKLAILYIENSNE